MIKILYKFIGRIILAFGLIYSFNLIMVNMNLSIPINIYTVLFIALLGFPGLFALVGLILLI